MRHGVRYSVSERVLRNGEAEFTTRDASGAVVSTVILRGYQADALRAARREGTKSNG